MWKSILGYGLMLALGTVVLQGLDYTRWVRLHSDAFYAFALAVSFLALGVWVGFRLFRPASVKLDGNPKAVEQLKLSERELEVLRELAVGLSNKEIAIKLNVSPNTVKTHVARILEKFDAKRRTDAINRARELGILT